MKLCKCSSKPFWHDRVQKGVYDRVEVVEGSWKGKKNEFKGFELLSDFKIFKTYGQKLSKEDFFRILISNR